MAKYPIFEEIAKTGKYADGIKRCNELLKKTPGDAPRLLVTKLRLQCAILEDHQETLDQLLALQPPITHTGVLFHIQEAVVSASKDVYPPILTVGPTVNKLWDNALKVASPNEKVDMFITRFESAVEDNRLQDCQQSLIGIKALKPGNKVAYLAHAAYTQLLSTSKEDLQSRLAISLARKAVAEKFDDQETLDCRVPGQIFAIQDSGKDLETIKDRRFRESKQVYHALKLSEPALSNGTTPADPTPGQSAKLGSREWVDAEVVKAKQDFARIMDSSSTKSSDAFVKEVIKLFYSSIAVFDLGGRDRGAADACYLAISGLVKLWIETKNDAYLLQAAYLADGLLKHNEHFHEARLILVYIYMHLGLGSLAMRLFDSLSIKEVQYDTVGHTLFTSISLLHPFKTATSHNGDFDPYERTQRALAIYPRHEEKLASCESGILNHGQTGMVFDIQELRTSLRTSLTRRTHVLEHRRISRLTGKPFGKNTSNVGPRASANWTNVKDTRDFQAAFNFGLNVEKALSPDGEEKEDLLHKLAADAAWCLATSQPMLCQDLDKLLEEVNKLPSFEDPKSPTAFLSHLCSIIGKAKTGFDPEVETVRKTIESAEKLITVPEPCTLAQSLQTVYQDLDYLRIILQTCRFVKDKATNIPVEIKELQDLGRQLVKDLQAYAKEQVSRVQVNAALEELGKDGRLKDFGDESVKDFAEKIVQSAKEGWEGVGKISIPGL